MVSAYGLSFISPVFSHIGIGCIVAVIANSEFHMLYIRIQLIVMCRSISFEFTAV